MEEESLKKGFAAAVTVGTALSELRFPLLSVNSSSSYQPSVANADLAINIETLSACEIDEIQILEPKKTKNKKSGSAVLPPFPPISCGRFKSTMWCYPVLVLSAVQCQCSAVQCSVPGSRYPSCCCAACRPRSCRPRLWRAASECSNSLIFSTKRIYGRNPYPHPVYLTTRTSGGSRGIKDPNLPHFVLQRIRAPGRPPHSDTIAGAHPIPFARRCKM
jgi:hypothetical protein